MKVVSESLGHSSIGITSEIYTCICSMTRKREERETRAYLSSATQVSRAANDA